MVAFQTYLFFYIKYNLLVFELITYFDTEYFHIIPASPTYYQPIYSEKNNGKLWQIICKLIYLSSYNLAALIGKEKSYEPVSTYPLIKFEDGPFFSRPDQ